MQSGDVCTLPHESQDDIDCRGRDIEPSPELLDSRYGRITSMVFTD
jgi:hypothetical protein